MTGRPADATARVDVDTADGPVSLRLDVDQLESLQLRLAELAVLYGFPGAVSHDCRV